METKSTPKVLIIGYVWPEPKSSAAGVRDWDLIRIFRQAGWQVTFVSPSALNEHSQAILETGIETHTFAANDSGFDAFVSELKPDLAIFDRFVIEEQFGWRVRDHSPRTIRVLDTQDLHFVRRARQKALAQGVALSEIFDGKIDFFTEDAYREIASIYRSDLTLVLSDFESDLLCTRFRIPESLLMTLGFAYPARDAASPGFSERAHFAMIGNFRHPPNSDAVLWLRNEIWPLIRNQSPAAEVHIYGAYPPREMSALDHPSSGFRVLGPAENSIRTLEKYRVNLAALRFGAGIKGKIADGWFAGTPAVTTPIGAEGMQVDENWGGFIARDALSFARYAVQLESDPSLWHEKSRLGAEILDKKFSFPKNASGLIDRLSQIMNSADASHRANFVGNMLWHHLHQSTKYFSRWIELKNQRQDAAPPQ